MKFLLLAIVCCMFNADGFAARAPVKSSNQNKPVQKARAASGQKAINLGTKIQVATTTSSPCQEKYDACMDTGCVMDNDSGGRCLCSDQYKDLSDKLEELKKKDADTYKIANIAKASIEDGEDVDEAMDSIFGDEESDFDVSPASSGATGDKLRAEMHNICIEKIPECKLQFVLVKNMYIQKIKSDCAAFDNALREQSIASKEKRAEAKKMVREAALEKYEENNKYDLGQCTIEFTKCIKTTAECGNDFTGCVDSVGKDKIYGKDIDVFTIKGENSSVVIAKSTYEMLESKKLICESVLKNCVDVKDEVWNAFLANSAPEIKLAENKSESNIRSSCLENISNCFINACKDSIEGDDKESYDMCLTRPETMKSLCRVQMEPCLAATGGSYDEPEKSTLWPSVLAKLSAMRADSCTEEMKECMQSEDRCGPDYANCIGLDTNIIMRMCPYDKLPGCQKVYGEDKIQGDEIYDEVARIIEGVILNIDNDLLKVCENAAETAMTKVCGSAESCEVYAAGGKIGAQSLKYQVCQYSTDSPDSTEGFKWFDCRESLDQISDAELGRVQDAKNEELGNVKPFAGVISGVIKWESVEITDDGLIDIDKYMEALEKEKITEEERVRVKAEIEQVQSDINRVISSVEQDQWLQFCISGRHITGVTDRFADNKVRFPKLANNVRKQIATAALHQAKENYYAEYDKLSAQMQQDLVTISERLANNLKENGKDAKKAAAREACVNLAAVSAFAKAPVGQSLWAKIIVGIIVVAAIIVATVFTCGVAGGASLGFLAGVATGSMITSVVGTISATGALIAASTATAVAGAAGISAAVDAGINATTDNSKIAAGEQTQNHGEYAANEWNYQEKITTDFDNDTMICKKCVVNRKCRSTKWSIFRDRYCSSWDPYSEPRCTEIQF
ncbi:MAG: hypothetical protein IKZ49_02670 [Alphaproteobacteria bacterium]|nr:hypothetical protein [Alphaproteobacteria bacterium]